MGKDGKLRESVSRPEAQGRKALGRGFNVQGSTSPCHMVVIRPIELMCKEKRREVR